MAGSFINASSQYLNLSSSLNVVRNVPGTTISVWVRPSGVATAYGIVYFSMNSATNAARASLSIQTGPVLYRCTGRRLVTDSSSNINSTTVPTAGVLVHLCGVYAWSGRYMMLYVNGIQENIISIPGWTGNVENTGSLGARIASRADGTAAGFYQGELEDVRVYDRALGANEVNNIYMSRGSDRITLGLVERWKIMDGPEGSIIGTTQSVGSNQGPAVSSGSPIYSSLNIKTRA